MVSSLIEALCKVSKLSFLSLPAYICSPCLFNEFWSVWTYTAVCVSSKGAKFLLLSTYTSTYGKRVSPYLVRNFVHRQDVVFDIFTNLYGLISPKFTPTRQLMIWSNMILIWTLRRSGMDSVFATKRTSQMQSSTAKVGQKQTRSTIKVVKSCKTKISLGKFTEFCGHYSITLVSYGPSHLFLFPVLTNCDFFDIMKHHEFCFYLFLRWPSYCRVFLTQCSCLCGPAQEHIIPTFSTWMSQLSRSCVSIFLAPFNLWLLTASVI